jgi:hypothetical protein
VKLANVRSAAIQAFVSSIRIVLTAVILLPVLSGINRLFEGTWRVNWRVTLTVAGILTVLWFGFLFISQLLEDFTQEKREESGRLILPGAMWLRGVCIGCMMLGIAVMLGTYREGDAPWIVVLPVLFVLLGFFTWPRKIEFSNGAIRQRRWLLSEKILPYDEIESASFNPGRGETIVFGRDGRKIVHTMMHVGRAEFTEHLESLTGKKVITLGI